MSLDLQERWILTEAFINPKDFARYNGIMKMIWEKKFEIGDDLIDRQHQALFNLTNDLGEAIENGEEHQIIDQVFSVLVLYVLEHFRDEEALMKKEGYLRFSSHKHEHMDLSIKVSDHLTRYRNQENKDPQETHQFLVEWITEHIMLEDYEFFEWLREKKARQKKII